MNGATPRQFDRYRVIRKIGRGGQGEVYLAHDPNLDIDVAIKVLHPDYRTDEFMDRFALEARTMVRLTAPNIVRVYDFNPSYPYLVLEYCADGDLAHVIKSRRPMTVTRSVSLVRQICQALMTAHEYERSTVHRDLKPGNVLFEKGVPKVADFGLAKVVGTATTGLTSTRGMMGTVGYASPEQLTDASKVDHRTDLWAVGVILYELLTFTGPFEKPGEDYVQVAIKVRTEPPANPPFELPAPLWEIIQRLLQKDPARRFDSARQIVRALDDALKAIPGADKLSLPPAEALGEIDRIAAQVADLLDSGSTDQAETLVGKMRQISPDSGLGRYWAKKIKEERKSEPSPSLPQSDTATRTQFDSLSSIKTLIAKRDYREARRLAGQLLIDDPDNTAVHGLLQEITNEERLFTQAINQAHEDAERARVSKDLKKVREIWESIDEQFPDTPDVKAELAVASRELDLLKKRELRGTTEVEAQRLLETGDRAGAVKLWDDYLEAHPGDTEVVAIREALHRELILEQKAVHLQALKEEAARFKREDRLDEALSRWESYLDESPESAEALREAHALRREIAARRHRVALAEAKKSDEILVRQDDLAGALSVWQQLLVNHPGDPAATARADELTRQMAGREKTRLLDEVRREAEGLERRLKAKRYASLKDAREAVSRALSGISGAAELSASKLTMFKDAIVAARDTAEAVLADALDARRRELRRQLSNASVLGAEDGGLTGGSEAEKTLDQAIGTAIAALGTVPTAETEGDPCARLDEARKVLKKGAELVAKERQTAIQQAQSRASAALGEAEQAILALQTTPGPASGVLDDAARLATELSDLRSRAQVQSASRLEHVAHTARSLRAEAESVRAVAVWNLSHDMRRLLDEALESLSLVPSDRLHELAARAVAAIEPGDGQLSDPAAMASLRDELRTEVEAHGRLRKEAVATANERWSQASAEFDAITAAGKGPGEAMTELREAGDAALQASRFGEVERIAGQMKSLASQQRLENAWTGQRDNLLRLEGPTDDDGVAVGPSDQESQALLSRFRVAVADGKVEELDSIAKDAARRAKKGARDRGRTADEGPSEVPDLSRRARRVNQRLHPTALEHYDKAVGELKEARGRGSRADHSRLAAAAGRSYGRLIKPPPAWRTWVPTVTAAALIAVLAVFFWPTPEPTNVTLVSIAGDVSVVSLTHEGKQLGNPPSETITEDGVTWPLDPGAYVVKTNNGGEISFEVPKDQTVVVPGPPGDYSRGLVDALGLQELTGSGQQ